MLEREFQWLDILDFLPNRLNISEIAGIFNRHFNYIKKFLEEGSYKRGQDGTYSKRVLNDIRNSELELSKQGDWLTLKQLSDALGRDREWVQNRINRLGVESEWRWGEQRGSKGIRRECYPPSSLEMLRNELDSEPQAGAAWWTAYRIQNEIGHRSMPWVQVRLRKYKHLGEPRLDDMGVTRVHYPPEVAKSIIAEAGDPIKSHKDDDWFTARDIAELVNRSMADVYRRLGDVAIQTQAEKRRSEGGRVAKYYPPNVAEVIMADSCERIDAALKGDWLSVPDISELSGMSQYMVVKKLGQLAIEMERRLTKNGRIVNCYPPNTPNLLGSMKKPIINKE